MPFAAMTRQQPGQTPGSGPGSRQHGNALGSKVFALGQDDVGKGLGGVADDVDVHPAQADAHHAPQPGGAELEQGEEAVCDLACVVGKKAASSSFSGWERAGLCSQRSYCAW